MGAKASFDGTSLPMYVGILGKVYDVSDSRNFEAGEGYGDLWAGRDATYALATLSLEKKDANRLDWEMSQFNEGQLKALAAWSTHFEKKYPVVGFLKEYEGRCVDLPASVLEAVASVQLPGVSGGDGIAAGTKPPGKAPRTEHL
eukprot:TRINITY_DN11057_c0_g1_i2.p2 TRINITY_DN11057_c0_g1~~TRINITY_DN11057_c0_g1_i2.p2  ORF type:complete len:144 (+),score=43.03 TRINITY_DN11057_c0_g1_i2:48-479(+)